MFKLICSPLFSDIYLQIQISLELTLILLAIIVTAVVLLIIIIMLVLRKRSHSKIDLPHSHFPMPFNHPQPLIDTSPTATVLEILRRDLEETSSAYSTGFLSKKAFEDKVAEVKRTFEDLKHFEEISSTKKNCDKCNTEIEKEAKFCDKCGAQQD